jgi:hypothetical protein
MPDFASVHTPRVFIRYRTLGLVHTIRARVARTSTVPEITAGLEKLAAILSSVPLFRFTDWAPLSAGYVQQDTGLELPLAIPTIAPGEASVSGRPEFQKTLQVRFEARSTAGGRTNLTLFGVPIDITTPAAANMRVTSVEAGFPTALWVGLSELSPQFVAADNAIAIWYPYYNIKLNDSFLGDLRS